MTEWLTEAMADGWKLWMDWHKAIAPDNLLEIETLEADRGRHLGYVRTVGTRTDAPVDEPIVAIPPQYTKRALLREAPRNFFAAGSGSSLRSRRRVHVAWVSSRMETVPHAR